MIRARAAAGAGDRRPFFAGSWSANCWRQKGKQRTGEPGRRAGPGPARPPSPGPALLQALMQAGSCGGGGGVEVGEEAGHNAAQQLLLQYFLSCNPSDFNGFVLQTFIRYAFHSAQKSVLLQHVYEKAPIYNFCSGIYSI